MKNHLSELSGCDRVGRKRLLSELRERKLYGIKGNCKFLEKLAEDGISVIAFDEEEYPDLLKQTPDFPVLLFVKGKKDLLKMKTFTAVGTRHMTQYGKMVCEEFFCGLENICIVSGLALGIDSQVHINCLKNNVPTIAVTAGGLRGGFPRCNQFLFDEISCSGLVVSEFPPGRNIVKGMFPMRNRILAGLSGGVLVIESDEKGGSMITAGLALDYGREILSVPGNIFSGSSNGCNLLIGEGASIVRNREHFLTLLNDCVQI